MEANDVKRLWALLAELYPRQRQAATRERLAAWTLALEPYDYAAIREAALVHARACAYYPSVSELTERVAPADPDAWMDEFIAAAPRA